MISYQQDQDHQSESSVIESRRHLANPTGHIVCFEVGEHSFLIYKLFFTRIHKLHCNGNE